MQAFSYWHAYYDSAFASFPFKIPNILYFELSIPRQVSKWPASISLPQLPKLFQLFQEAIIREENWIECLNSQKQMEDLESEVNLLLVNFQCQKQYGGKFWQKDLRRVQSSVVHYYLYFKNFISNLIPKDCGSLIEATRKKKLAFSFKRLEILVNGIFSHLKSIHLFLFQDSFKQEGQLVKLFLQDFIKLLQNLPKISSESLKQIPKLMEYICIVNPLEAERSQQSQSVSSVRRKNATTADLARQKDKRQSQEKKFGNNSAQLARRSTIFHIKEQDERFNLNFSTPRDLAKHIRLFKFKQKIRTQSFYRSSKKPTISSFETKQKTASITKSRSPSDDKSFSFLDQQKKKRTQTIQQTRPKQLSFYLERRSRQTHAKSISKDKSATNKFLTYNDEDAQLERDNKNKKKKGTKLVIRMTNISNLADLQKGKSKGWGYLRQWFQMRLAKRKLKALLNEF